MFERVIQRLDRLAHDLPELVGNEVVNLTLDNFRNESYFGSKWPALSKDYAKRKRRGQGLLRKSTRLFQSIGIVKRSKYTVSVGIKGGRGGKSDPRVYGAVHNRGLRIRGGKMPRRQFLGQHPKQTQELQSLIIEEIQQAFR